MTVDEWQEPEGVLGDVLALLRRTDPDEARRVEKGIASVRARADEAATAALDLRAALAAMALDLRRDKSPKEHIASAVTDSVRRSACLRYLAQVNGANSSELEDPERFLAIELLRDDDDWNDWHDQQLLRLRDAVRIADAVADQRP